MYERYARYMLETVRKKNGNYLAFFPSYRFLNDVYEAFLALQKEEEEIFCLIQDPGMTEEEREEFLNYFEEERDGSLIGFCVMGGIFFRGDRSDRRAADRDVDCRHRTSTGLSGERAVKAVF